ncbi:MAG: DUF4232 domain-containing protein [Acidimicrobiales bacterium]|jgi:hypothetical protein
MSDATFRKSCAVWALGAVALALAVTPVGSSSAAKAPAPRPCSAGALQITVENGDGLHHGVEVIRFANVGGASCVLSGYPKIQALLDSAPAPKGLAGMYTPARRGARKSATDVQWAWAGGVDVDDVPLKTFIAPRIVLAPHKGVATATLNWIDGPNGAATCHAFSDLVIGVDGFSVTRFVKTFEPLCYEFVVTPIVKGASGQMFVKVDYSLKANDLSSARDEAASFLSEALALHHEITHPHDYTVYQRIAAASYLQNADVVQKTPWPKLNLLLASVAQESNDVGNYEVMHLVNSGYAKTVNRDYAALLLDIKRLNKLLQHLS